MTVAITGIAMILMVELQALGERAVDALVGGFSAEGRSLTLDFIRIMALGMPASAMINVLAAGEIALGRTRLTNIRASILRHRRADGHRTGRCVRQLPYAGWVVLGCLQRARRTGALHDVAQGVLSFKGLSLSSVLASGRQFFRRLRPLLVLVAEQANIWIERAAGIAGRDRCGGLAGLCTHADRKRVAADQSAGRAGGVSHTPKDVGAQIEGIARPILALAVPASVFLAMFAPEIVRLVFCAAPSTSRRCS